MELEKPVSKVSVDRGSGSLSYKLPKKDGRPVNAGPSIELLSSPDKYWGKNYHRVWGMGNYRRPEDEVASERKDTIKPPKDIST